MHWKLKLTIHVFLSKQLSSRTGQKFTSRAAQKIPLIFFECPWPSEKYSSSLSRWWLNLEFFSNFQQTSCFSRNLPSQVTKMWWTIHLNATDWSMRSWNMKINDPKTRRSLGMYAADQKQHWDPITVKSFSYRKGSSPKEILPLPFHHFSSETWFYSIFLIPMSFSSILNSEPSLPCYFWLYYILLYLFILFTFPSK